MDLFRDNLRINNTDNEIVLFEALEICLGETGINGNI